MNLTRAAELFLRLSSAYEHEAAARRHYHLGELRPNRIVVVGFRRLLLIRAPDTLISERRYRSKRASMVKIAIVPDEALASLGTSQVNTTLAHWLYPALEAKHEFQRQQAPSRHPSANIE